VSNHQLDVEVVKCFIKPHRLEPLSTKYHLCLPNLGSLDVITGEHNY
jgi:hypothetical protein